MAWVDPPTRATGDLITAAIWNQDVVANMESSPHLLAESILGGDVASITFSSIVQTPFRHLELVLATRTSQAVVLSSIGIQFNGDTGANYAYGLDFMAAAVGGTANDAQTRIAMDAPGNSATASRVLGGTLTILDYARTNWHKMVAGGVTVIPSASTADWKIETVGGLWKSTAAITSITILGGSGNLKAGSIFSLFGVP